VAPPLKTPKTLFARRLQQARLETGLSQMELGVVAGIDELSASARMNQYERSVSEPDDRMVEKLAAVLGKPVMFFYCSDDAEAELLCALHRLPVRKRAEYVRSFLNLLKEH
jgi:transcriptional regulator with XRE-family HTH domain